MVLGTQMEISGLVTLMMSAMDHSSTMALTGIWQLQPTLIVLVVLDLALHNLQLCQTPAATP